MGSAQNLDATSCQCLFVRLWHKIRVPYKFILFEHLYGRSVLQYLHIKPPKPDYFVSGKWNVMFFRINNRNNHHVCLVKSAFTTNVNETELFICIVLLRFPVSCCFGQMKII